MTIKDEVTVLRCISPGAVAVKTFTARENGNIVKTSFEAGYFFEHHTVEIQSIYDLEKAIKETSQELSQCVIRGRVKNDAGPVIRRVLHGAEATVEDVERHWVALDFDKISFSEDFDAVERPEELINFLIQRLPPIFHDVSCVFKFSSSQNVPEIVGQKPLKKVSAHLFFLCNNAVSGNTWKQFFAQNSTPVDLAVFGAVQPLFIASPIFKGMQDPLPKRIGLLKRTKDEVDVSNIQRHVTLAAKNVGGAIKATEKMAAAGRNEALFKEICRLRHFGYSEEFLRIFSHALNEAKPISLHPKYQEGALEGSEVEKILASAMKYDGKKSEDDFLTLEQALEKMNEKYAIVMEAGKTLIISSQHDKALHRARLNRSKFADIRDFYKDKVLLGYDPEKKKPIFQSLGSWWLDDLNARRYDRVVFEPYEQVENAYNLWRGFGVEPQAGGTCRRFHAHLLDNICRGNKEHYSYILKWLARMFQQPTCQGETIIALRGMRGTGKGAFASIIGRLVGQHYLQISNSKHLVGNFNAHLQDVIFLFCDEAFWAGDKAGESVLKTLATENSIFIEPKNFNAFSVPNYLHILMASNNDWVVPAGLDERRFFVLEVGEGRKQDHAYFKALKDEMEQGGYAALLHELLHMNISDFNVRAVPQTNALLEQKLRSMSPEHKWIFTKLDNGRLMDNDAGWNRVVGKAELQKDYVEKCKDAGVVRRDAQTELGMMLKKLFPSLRNGKKDNLPAYRFPILEESRKAFEKAINAKIDWTQETEESVGNLDELEEPFDFEAQRGGE